MQILFYELQINPGDQLYKSGSVYIFNRYKRLVSLIIEHFSYKKITEAKPHLLKKVTKQLISVISSTS